MYKIYFLLIKMTLKALNLKVAILYTCTIFKKEQMWAQQFVKKFTKD